MVNRVRGRGCRGEINAGFSFTIHLCFHSSKLNVYDDSAPLYHCSYYSYLKVFCCGDK